jgi:hypothetical protein
VTRRRTILVLFGMYNTVTLGSLGVAVGAVLALKSAGWTFVPSMAVAGVLLLGSRRLLWRLALRYARHRDGRKPGDA